MKRFLFLLAILMCFSAGAKTPVEKYVDKRDGKEYTIITINKLKVMAENFAYVPDDGAYWFHEGKEENVKTYGVMYDFYTLEQVIPEGWRLPTKIEMLEICEAMGKDEAERLKNLSEGGKSGLEFKTPGYESYEEGFMPATTKFWTDTSCGPALVWCLTLDEEGAYMSSENTQSGLYLRLIKK